MASLAVTGTPDLINPDPGDLALTAKGCFFMRGTGDFPALPPSTLRDEVDQRLRVRFQFFSGEWFLNLDAGTPYFQHILVKAPNEQTIRSIFSQVIRKTEGVQDILEFSYDLNKRTRKLTIAFEATLEDGTTFRSTDYAPYVIVS